MADFLLELRSEEIPARMQDKACADLMRLFGLELASRGLEYHKLTTFVTPRRLALIARDLPTTTPATREETKGPRASAPPQALEGFLRKTGLAREQLVERDGVLFAVVERPGRATADVLADAIPAIVRAFPWPKSMRWGAASASPSSLRWVRPLQGIVALLDEHIVPLAVDGIHSGAATLGHRFHHPGPITIGSAHDYAEKLRACHVIVDAAERHGIIEGGARAVAAARGLHVVPDAGLVAENAGLTEWPVPLLGEFDAAFLEVPREVIQLTMRTNQKYFACVDGDGRLAPAFICTANVQARDGGAGIVAGNRKVLAARLADARFFWEQDKKVPLAEQAKKLDRIVFHEKLGTVADKVARVARLARWLVEEGVVAPHVDPAERARLADLAQQAAELAKADLVTGMVGEFPELQGVMGGYYAAAEGLPREVSDAVRDHYKPVGQGDDVPTAPVTVAVSLADKLDSVGVFFTAEMPPSGSRDPFGLRRSSLGIISLAIASNLHFGIEFVISLVRDMLWQQREQAELARDQERSNLVSRALSVAEIDESTLSDSQSVQLAIATHQNFEFLNRNAPAEVLVFMADRLKAQQREAGVRHDLIDAVFALGGEDDLVRLLARVHALQAFVTTAEGANLLAGYKRAANILKKEGWTSDEPAAPPTAPEPAEAALVAALDRAEPAADAAVAAERFEDAMAALATLRAPIDAFFGQVTVNDPDPVKRASRLALLARIRGAVHRVADFSKVVDA